MLTIQQPARRGCSSCCRVGTCRLPRAALCECRNHTLTDNKLFDTHERPHPSIPPQTHLASQLYASIAGWSIAEPRIGGCGRNITCFLPLRPPTIIITNGIYPSNFAAACNASLSEVATTANSSKRIVEPYMYGDGIYILLYICVILSLLFHSAHERAACRRRYMYGTPRGTPRLQSRADIIRA